MTVSRAFRKDTYVRADLRKRVLALAETMGYSPDPRISSFMKNFVRRSKSGYHETLAFIQYSLTPQFVPNPFSNLFYNGARKRAESLGFRLNYFVMGPGALTSAQLERVLRQRGIRGLIVGPPEHHPHSHMRIDWPRYAVAAIGSSLWKPRVNRVQPHHYLAMVLGLRNLRRFGRTRVVLPLESLFHARTLGAYMASFLANQAAKPQDLNSRIYLYRTWEPKPFLKLIDQTRADAVLCSDIDEAARIASLLRNRDIGLACLNVASSVPQFAGVVQHYEYIGTRAADLVLNALQNKEFGLPIHPISIMVEGSWRDGPSLTLKERVKISHTRKELKSVLARTRSSDKRSSQAHA